MYNLPNVDARGMMVHEFCKKEGYCVKYIFQFARITAFCLAGEVLAAVLSCAYSYEIIAKKIVANRPESVDDPFYGDWIRGYASDEYAAGNVMLIETLDRLSAHYAEEQLRNLEDIFIACSRYEMAFWQMAWEIRL